MYKVLWVFSALVLSSSLWAAKNITVATEVALDPEGVHVPRGFDANDQVEVVVTGHTLNTCYKRPTGFAKIVGNKIFVEMKATKISGKDVFCIQARVPYVVSIFLGTISQGDYTVAINTGKESEKTSTLHVDVPGSDSMDNFTYANVLNITKSSDKTSLMLSGEHPSSCMEIDRVELIPNESGDTVTVLPIVRQISRPCDYLMTPFSLEIPINYPEKHDVVYHVRRIDGRAVNFRM